MEPPRPTEKGQKIENLEQELNDLRQGLVVVMDYYQDLKDAEQIASLELDEGIVKPLMEDDLDFESIWRFHEDVLLADPSARVPCNAMYEAFEQFCSRSGRYVGAGSLRVCLCPDGEPASRLRSRGLGRLAFALQGDLDIRGTGRFSPPPS